MRVSLSANEARVVLPLMERPGVTLTVHDIRLALGASPSYARFLAHRLASKGWLVRCRRGLYRLGDPTRGDQRASPSEVSRLVGGEHYFSYGTALAHLGIRAHGEELHIVVPAVRRAATLGGWRCRFIAFTPARFFGWLTHEDASGQIPLASRERLVIDLLARPAILGDESEGHVASLLPAVDGDLLARMATRLGRPSLLRAIERGLRPGAIESPAPPSHDLDVVLL